jgi:23S rRNA (adenine2503-C2)-methyltransferase
LKILATAGSDEIARVFLAELSPGRTVEFVEAVQPPLPRGEKWVLMVSTMLGCPVGCPMCDAGGDFRGRLTAEEILEQIDYLVERRRPDGRVPARKFKIQLARLGEPALNPAVLEALRRLPGRYEAPGLLPSLSTVAPRGCAAFLEELTTVKDALYPAGRFQLQFSLHTTDAARRDELIPTAKWDFDRIARFAEDWLKPDDRLITLNFALGRGVPLEAAVLRRHFNPQRFLLKITPLNPTYRARSHGLVSHLDPAAAPRRDELIDGLRAAGYRVIVSLGEREEDRIGSNCGQFLRRHLESNGLAPADGYTYPVVGDAAGDTRTTSTNTPLTQG